MSKAQAIAYVCQQCAAQCRKWQGQCADCGAWNSLQEERVTAQKRGHTGQRALAPGSQVIPLAEVEFQEYASIDTGMNELNRVLGGGLVSGAVVLLGGDPGIGKSTLLMQALGKLSATHKTLYVTGEESIQQIAMRAQRLGVQADTLNLLAETQVEAILAIAEKTHPRIIVVDSIQTMATDSLSSAPGGVGQVRESAAQFVQFAKRTGTALFIVGHVTKEGTIAGPRVLEHMVDTVLYFEGKGESRLRMVRAIKNRFGAVNELGVFAMTEQGLREVSNPSAIFLSRDTQPAAGSVVMVTWEGSRPLLVEVQALVTESQLANPRRVTLGLEQNRLAMLLAVLQRHGKIATFNQDVFVNIVGGVRVTETAADLAVLLAVVSSLRDQPIPHDLITFGEVGLAGEVRPVQSGLERINEASKHGFKRAIVPSANAAKNNSKVAIHTIKNLAEALQAI